MDAIDRQLLTLLHQNSRSSIVELSRLVNLSRPSVKERIDKLTEQGIIKNFTITIDQEKIDPQLLFFTELSHVTWSSEQIIDYMSHSPYVLEVHIVSGEVNYLVKAMVKNTNEMKKLLTEWMTFANIKSTIVLDTIIDNRLHLDSY